MQGNGGQGTRAGRRLVVVVACLCGLVLSVVGASGVLALAGVVSSPSSTVAGVAPAPAAVPTTPGPATPTAPAPTVTVTLPPTPAPSAPPTVAAPTPRPPTQTPRPAPTAARPGATLHPVVGITDGDTIKVRVGGTTERVRVIGLDAPELRGAECWSQKASSRMQSLVQSRSVQLVGDPTQDDRDRYGRLLRHVVTADGKLVAQALIEGGFAKEYTYDRAYAHRDAYRAAQDRARSKRLGVWSAACAAPAPVAPVAPVAPAPTAAPAAPVRPSGSCVIKGNISSSGERIYHVPGGGSYDVTVITASKGERWFCSEQAAEAAGWRKARN
ncbi:thermonuclease family protein [Knoellia sp. CPCC 206435]|uniref:thermonuclease family protein n=1 Tax=Knoellia terrae TaxID=3404797 RepID=UPI003B430A04